MKKFIIAIIFISLFTLITSHVFAQGLFNSETITKFTDTTGKVAGFAPTTSIGDVIANVIRGALALLSIIFLLLTIFAGFQWMTAGGNEEAIKKAQGTIKSALIGLVVVLAAWGIVYFIFTYLPFAGGGSNMVAG